jgi:hypothetical protein
LLLHLSLNVICMYKFAFCALNQARTRCWLLT